MSKGPGIIQRRVVEAFEASPNAWLSIDDLAAHCYPGEAVEKKHRDSVGRAVRAMTGIRRMTRGLDTGAGHKVLYRLGSSNLSVVPCKQLLLAEAHKLSAKA